jgi:hypothetical protein
MTINSDDDPEEANIKEMQDELQKSQEQPPMPGFQQAEEHIEKVLQDDDQSTSA